MKYDLTDKRIFVAGHKGMAGAAVVRRLQGISAKILSADRTELDLTQQASVSRWMKKNQPQVVVLAAAKVGGIHANQTRPVDFLYENLMIEVNVIHAAYQAGVEKLLFLGSSCIYPKLADQPITEDALLTGPLESTNEAYAIAKIAGIKLCQAYRQQHQANFISAQPTNLYGPGDNYDLQTSHVLPALLRKFHEAKEAGSKQVVLWGTGSPLREFLHVDDLADALVFLLENYSDPVPLNVGSGSEVTIKQLAKTIAGVVGYQADLVFDTGKPDGTPRKLMSSQRLHKLGWNRVRSLKEGLHQTYESFLKETT